LGHNERLRLDLDLFGQMREQAEKQRDALMADRLDEFMLHASLRQSIQKAISASRKGNRATEMSAAKRGTALPGEITQAIQIIEAIQETDKEIEGLIALKREALMSQMKEIRHGRKALRGYGKPNQDPGGRFFESRG
jgi:lipopolysaccharide biosynthesis regulator YciM